MNNVTKAAFIIGAIVIIVAMSFHPIDHTFLLQPSFVAKLTSPWSGTEEGGGAVREKRWAVLVVGGSRTYAFARDNFLQYIVNAPPSIPMDVFSYTYYDRKCSFFALSAIFLKEDCTDYFLQESNTTLLQPNIATKTQDRYGQQIAALQMMEGYAERNNITYDYVIATRPDLLHNRMLNVSLIQQSIDDIGDSALLIPECCNFGGYCDRFSIASFTGMKRMLQCFMGCIDPGMAYEQSMMDRSNKSNMIAFDLVEAYSFATLRREAIEDHCRPDHPQVRPNGWVDVVCLRSNDGENQPFQDTNEFIPPVLPTSVCHIVNATNEMACTYRF
jgi:hypothetical protein